MHGIHESGLAFQNAVKKAMESRCSMIKSKVIPATWLARELYTRVQCKEDDVPEEFGGTVAKEFVILTISTDYFRYIGTRSEDTRLNSSHTT